MPDRPEVRRILLIRLSAIGDVINTLPAVAAIRAAYPKAHITYVTEDRAKDLVIGHPDLDRSIVFPRRRWRRWLGNPLRWPWLVAGLVRYVRELRRGGPDLALDFQGNLKGGLHSRGSGATVRIGFVREHSKELNHWFSTLRVEPASPRINRVEKFLALAAPLGIDGGAVYRLPSSRESLQRVDGFFASAGLVRGGYALLHPGTSALGIAKRWPLDRFAALAGEIHSKLRLPVVVAWGPGEKSMAEEIARSSPAKVAFETASLLDLAELIRRARFFVGADSGPLHLSSAVGVPSVALFGPKDPLIYAPWNPRHRVVRKPDGRMESITVADAFVAVEAIS